MVTVDSALARTNHGNRSVEMVTFSKTLINLMGSTTASLEA